MLHHPHHTLWIWRRLIIILGVVEGDCVCVGGAGTGARALVFVQAKRPRGWGSGDMDGPCKACEDEGCQKKKH